MTATTVSEQAALDETLQPVDVIASSSLANAGLMQLVVGHYSTQVLTMLAQTGVLDALGDGRLAATELAEPLGLDPRALHRLLRAGATLRVLDHHGDETFTITDTGHFMRSDYPFSMASLAKVQGMPWHWQPWTHAVDALRNGRSFSEAHEDRGFYEYLQGHPGATAAYAAAMNDLAQQGQLLALPLHDWSGYDTVIDIAGGEGSVLLAALEQKPDAKGILFDLPEVAARFQPDGHPHPAASRVAAAGGDMFEAVPAGGDCYVLSMVVNDHDDEHVSRLLRNVHGAMRPGGTLVVLDMTLPAPGTPSFASLVDIECLVVSGGVCRTEEQLRTLLAEAGFSLRCTRRGISPVCVHEADWRDR